MKVGSVATRYAGALFELASEKGELDRIQRDVEFLAAEVSETSVSGFLFDPRVSVEEKRKRIAFLEPHLHRLTYSFVQLLLDKRRIDVLEELLVAFRRRALRERGAAEGVVETPRPMGPGELAGLTASLSARLGKDVILESKVVPELIGGVRVIVENRMIDYTVKGRLGELTEKLRSAPLSEAP